VITVPAQRRPYTWLVWPAFGSQAKPRYGKLLGQSTFIFTA
jgi:hypothetical protein